jgi:hypothetical protein
VPPREPADAAVEDAAVAASDTADRAAPGRPDDPGSVAAVAASDTVDRIAAGRPDDPDAPREGLVADRYGRGRAHRRRDRWLIVGAAAAFAVVLVAWVVWAGLDGSKPLVEATDLSHRVLNDERAVEVTWRLSVPSGNETACIVEAFNEDFTVVGWKVVEIPASDRPLRTFTERVRIAQPANTGLISHCWLT